MPVLTPFPKTIIRFEWITLPIFIFMLSVFYSHPYRSWSFLALMVLFMVCSLYKLFLWRKESPTQRVSFVDAILALVLLYEIINFYLSAYSPNSFIYLERITCFIAFYFLLRLYVHKEYLLRQMVFLLSITGLVFALINLDYFISFYARNRDLADLSDFKYLYKPLGINSNELASVFICFLSFPACLLVNSRKWTSRCCWLITIALLIFGVLVTFSRGAYIALGVWFVAGFSLLCTSKVISMKQAGRWAFISGIVIILAAIPIYRPVLTTVAIDKTLSQKLSTEGRKELFNTGLVIFRNHAVTGIGSNNFPLMYAVFKRRSEDVKFNGNVTNSYLLLLIEKGLVGFLLYGSLFAIVFIDAWRKLRSAGDPASRAGLIVFVCSLLALLIRELFYASVFINDHALFLSIIMIYVCAWHSGDQALVLPGKKMTIALYLVMLAVLGVILFPLASRIISKEYYMRGVERYNNGVYDDSKRNFERAVQYDNGNAIAEAYTALSIVRKRIHEVSVEEMLSPSYRPDPSNSQPVEAAIGHYSKAVALNPDDIFFHNLGWLYFMKQDNEKARNYFSMAVAADPNVALYHISLGLAAEKEQQLEQALEEFATAIRLSPDILDSDFFRSLNKRSPGMARAAASKAQQGLEAFFNKTHDIKIQARLAKIYLYNEQDQAAFRLLKEVTNKLPNLNRPYLYLGDIYAARKDTAKMLEYYYLGSTIDPTDFLADVKLGSYYYAIHDTSRANNFYQAGYYKWSTIFPEYSTKTAIIYRLKRSIHNPIVPLDMLQYIKSFPPHP